jgi:zinc transport system substrate-binding protein
MNTLLRLFTITILGVVLAAPAAVAAPLRVFVSILPLQTFVEQVGGDHVAVRVMVGPGQEPESYEPTPRQMAELAATRLYFRIGVPFENVWMSRIVANNPQLTVVDLRRGLTLKTLAAHTHEGAWHGSDKAIDPHVWTSPMMVKTMVGTIAEALGKADPANAAAYRANAAAYAAKLDALDGEIRRLLAPIKNKKFLVFHPAWGYFADAYGLKQIAIEAGGKEPGARALAELIARSKKEGIRVIFIQEQFSRRLAETVAKAIGARVVAVDPLAANYIANMRRVAEAFAKAMETP